MYYLYDVKPIAFYPYTSRVVDRVCYVEYHNGDRIHRFRNELLRKFQAEGIQCALDNKIVFEVEKNGRRIFYGFYDWMFSVGFGVTSNHKGWRKEDARNVD